MNKASTQNKKNNEAGSFANGIDRLLSFHSTAEFGRSYYKNHCGPTAITNLIITGIQMTEGRILTAKEAVSIFENVASLGMKRLVYNRKHGTTDLLLRFFVTNAFNRFSNGTLRPGSRHVLSPKNLDRVIARGSFAMLELFGHPRYGWHQMLVYGVDENGDYIACDGIAFSPVHIPPSEIGRGLFLEIKHA